MESYNFPGKVMKDIFAIMCKVFYNHDENTDIKKYVHCHV